MDKRQNRSGCIITAKKTTLYRHDNQIICMVMPEGKHDLKKVIQSLPFSSNKYQIYEYFT
jgi:hypothetical protein